MRALSGLALSLLVLASAGCDLLQSRHTEVTGVVVNGSTGQPLEGLSVAFWSGGWAGGAVLASDRTDAQGRFELAVEDAPVVQLHVNSDPYNPRFTTYWEGIRPGSRRRQSYEVYEGARLTVRSETDRPLRSDEWHQVRAGCLTGIPPFTDTCQRGNALNPVTLMVKRRFTALRATTYQVYVRVGVDNEFTVRY